MVREPDPEYEAIVVEMEAELDAVMQRARRRLAALEAARRDGLPAGSAPAHAVSEARGAATPEE
jgi:hypothetical protein